MAVGLIFFGLFGWLFFRTTRGLGKSVFIIFSILLAVLFVFYPTAQLWGFAILALFAALTPRFSAPKRDYEHAVSRVEGGGVKRGLTPPEAAVLIGTPFNTILTLVVFGLLRKGILQHESITPFVVSMADGFRTREKSLNPERRANLRRKAAESKNLILYDYEEIFIELLEQNHQIRVHEVDYSILTKPFVQFIAERIAGYDLEETREYYRLIVKRAPKEARADGVLVAEKEKIFDHNLLWILLNADFQEILDSGSQPYLPVWVRSEQGILVSFTKGKTFATWTVDVMEEMKASVPESALKIKLGKEIDNITAKLMDEISRATFYG